MPIVKRKATLIDKVSTFVGQALAWLMDGRPPMIPVVGASTVAQLDEQLGAVDLRLDDDVRKRLDQAGRHADG